MNVQKDCGTGGWTGPGPRGGDGLIVLCASIQGVSIVWSTPIGREAPGRFYESLRVTHAHLSVPPLALMFRDLDLVG
jgi:hypothetical protein